jgi:dienelactone hydrolase
MNRRTVVLRVLSLLAVLPAASGAQAVADAGAFILRLGTDTLVIEHFSRVADTLQGSIGVKGQPRQDYLVILGPAGSITTVSLNIFAVGADAGAAPIQRVRVRMTGDSALVEANGRVQGFATSHGAFPLLNNSFALSEIFARRARARGGDLDIPVWTMAGAMSLNLSIRALGRDSMVFALAGQQQRLRVDSGGRILGGSIPGQHVDVIRVSGPAAATLRLGRVDYSAPAGAPYTATEVTLTGPGGITLGGTLTIPTGFTKPVPAIVTITGSGQEDRDESIPLVPGYRPFRQVADTLARRGIAVLRLDDRMVGLSGGPLGTSADYADDIRAALKFLRARPEIDGARLGLVGHSEGGLIAPMVAASDAQLKGIVLLAGPADKGSDILRYQQREAIAHDRAIPVAARDSALRVAARALDSVAATSVWLKYFLSYDPLPTAARVTVPVLILQGATDHQVTPDQAEKLRAAIRGGGNRDVTVHLYPGLNHLFIADPSGEPAGYASLKNGRVDPQVLGALADWLVARLQDPPQRP